MRSEIGMTRKELKRLQVMTSVIEGRCSIKNAAEVLALSERQIKRLKAGVKKDGAEHVVHKNAGRQPKHTITEERVEEIVTLVKERYRKLNHTHACELLAREHDIHIGRSTLSRILNRHQLTSPKTHRAPKRHPTRARKEQEMMMVQIDATPYDWLGTGNKLALHGAVDDATGKVMSLHFAPTETLNGYFNMLEKLIRRHGVPASIYADRHTIFQAASKAKRTIEDDLLGKAVTYSQFENAVLQLGSTLLAAQSPQAKGRIERLWETLQSRLAAELQLEGIDDIDAANAFLPTFIHSYNNKFAVRAQTEGSAALPVPLMPLKYILCSKHSRKIDHGCSFSFEGKRYQAYADGKVLPLPAGTTVTVMVLCDGSLKVFANSDILSVKPVPSVALRAAMD